MATVQVRDVPDDVAEVIAAKARARRKSMSAYLRDLIAEDAKQELQRRELEQWEARLAETHARLRLTGQHVTPSATVVREIREEYERGTR